MSSIWGRLVVADLGGRPRRHHLQGMAADLKILAVAFDVRPAGVSGAGIAVQGFLQGIHSFLPLTGRRQGHAQVAQGEGRFRMVAQQLLADGRGLAMQGDALLKIAAFFADAPQYRGSR